ncbi:MAG: hypothetical protein ACUVQ6_04670 [Dissulfurimicrobium sp.]|uniref:hypothetical protein n=1 Tax=Dissulfurimicrobium sp. TaxID=2022436 RepID=UPI00404AED72
MFFDKIQIIIEKMSQDRTKIEKTSKELLRLNLEMERIVSERTRAEMALRIAHEARNPVMIIGGLIQKIIKNANRRCRTSFDGTGYGTGQKARNNGGEI